MVGEYGRCIGAHIATGDPDERRLQLFWKARMAFSVLPRRTLVVCEEPLALKNGKTTRLLNLAAGAIWAAHLEFNLFWVWADVAAWKREVIGNGNASKDQIEAWVKTELGFTFDAEDYYDAAALAQYGRRQLDARSS